VTDFKTPGGIPAWCGRLHSATPIGDKILIFGGNSGSHITNRFCVIDTAEQGIHEVDTLRLYGGRGIVKRYNHCAHLVGRELIVYGGWRRGAPLQDVDSFVFCERDVHSIAPLCGITGRFNMVAHDAKGDAEWMDSSEDEEEEDDDMGQDHAMRTFLLQAFGGQPAFLAQLPANATMLRPPPLTDEAAAAQARRAGVPATAPAADASRVRPARTAAAEGPTTAAARSVFPSQVQHPAGGLPVFTFVPPAPQARAPPKKEATYEDVD
jgi:hypothetical protein